MDAQDLEVGRLVWVAARPPGGAPAAESRAVVSAGPRYACLMADGGRLEWWGVQNVHDTREAAEAAVKALEFRA